MDLNQFLAKLVLSKSGDSCQELTVPEEDNCLNFLFSAPFGFNIYYKQIKTEFAAKFHKNPDDRIKGDEQNISSTPKSR